MKKEELIEKFNNFENENKDEIHYLFLDQCRSGDKDLIIEMYNILKKYPDFNIHIFEDLAFKVIKNNDELIQVFIFNFNIKCTEHIELLLKDNEKIAEYFKMRELNIDLKASLHTINKTKKLSKL